MPIAKVIFNGETQMDTTGMTVDTSHLLTGYTALDRTGAVITGNAVSSVEAISVTEELDSHGGTIKHINAVNISDTTAVAADVAQGKYFYTAAGVKTAGTSSGGGGSSLKALNFIDYDGTIVNSYTAQEAQALSSLPANPSHTGLTAQGWNWTLANIKSYLTSYPNAVVNVGQMYTTSSGLTEIDVTIKLDGLHPYMSLAVDGVVSINWGDGSSIDTLSGSSLTTQVYKDHTYSEAGNYTISILATSGSFTFYTSASNSAPGILRVAAADEAASISRKYAENVTAVRLGTGITTIGAFAFQSCFGLEYITIPNTVTTINGYAFNYCLSLKSLTIPTGVTTLSNYAFQYCFVIESISLPHGITTLAQYAFSNCFALKYITIPSTVTSVATRLFQYCYALKDITIPTSITSLSSYFFYYCHGLSSIKLHNNITSMSTYTLYNCHVLKEITLPSSLGTIGNYMFQNCFGLRTINITSNITSIGTSSFQYCESLTKLTFPSTLTSIAAQAFSACRSMEEYHFQSTAPPTLANTNAFTGIPSYCKIYVPYSADHSVLNAYKTASNWSTYADYIVEEPQS